MAVYDRHSPPDTSGYQANPAPTFDRDMVSP